MKSFRNVPKVSIHGIAFENHVVSPTSDSGIFHNQTVFLDADNNPTALELTDKNCRLPEFIGLKVYSVDQLWALVKVAKSKGSVEHAKEYNAKSLSSSVLHMLNNGFNDTDISNYIRGAARAYSLSKEEIQECYKFVPFMLEWKYKANKAEFDILPKNTLFIINEVEPWGVEDLSRFEAENSLGSLLDFQKENSMGTVISLLMNGFQLNGDDIPRITQPPPAAAADPIVSSIAGSMRRRQQGKAPETAASIFQSPPTAAAAAAASQSPTEQHPKRTITAPKPLHEHSVSVSPHFELVGNQFSTDKRLVLDIQFPKPSPPGSVAQSPAFHGSDQPPGTKNPSVDVVLILDTSLSMGGRMDILNQTCRKIAQKTLSQGKNVSVITFSDRAELLPEYTPETDLKETGSTNIEDALKRLDELLATLHDPVSVSMISDGDANTGATSSSVLAAQLSRIISTHEHKVLEFCVFGVGDGVGLKLLQDLSTADPKCSMNVIKDDLGLDTLASYATTSVLPDYRDVNIEILSGISLPSKNIKYGSVVAPAREVFVVDFTDPDIQIQVSWRDVRGVSQKTKSIRIQGTQAPAHSVGHSRLPDRLFTEVATRYSIAATMDAIKTSLESNSPLEVVKNAALASHFISSLGGTRDSFLPLKGKVALALKNLVEKGNAKEILVSSQSMSSRKQNTGFERTQTTSVPNYSAIFDVEFGKLWESVLSSHVHQSP